MVSGTGYAGHRIRGSLAQTHEEPLSARLLRGLCCRWYRGAGLLGIIQLRGSYAKKRRIPYTLTESLTITVVPLLFLVRKFLE